MASEKKLNGISVSVDGSETAVEVTDTTTTQNATNAIQEIERYAKDRVDGLVHIVDDDTTYLIPYHAITLVAVTSEVATIDRTDPYGCDEEESGSESE